MQKKILVFLVLLSWNLAISQSHNWTRSNPGGGGAYSTIAVGPTGTAVACSDLSGIYISYNHGASWEPRGAAQGLTETHISGVGFHPTDPNYIFVGTEYGAFRSSNGGSTFQRVLTGGYITDIALSGTGVGYMGYHSAWNSLDCKIYKTINNGTSWSSTGSGFPTNHHILKIEVDPTNSNIVYVLTGKGRFTCGDADLFKSTDGGTTWTNLTSSLISILDFAFDPFNNNRIFITTMDASCTAQYYWTSVNGSLYVSNNGGSSWDPALSNVTGIIWPSFTNQNKIRIIDPREPWPWNAKAGTYTSTNGGTSFTKTGDVNQWDVFFNWDLFYCYSTSYNGIVMTLGLDPSDDNRCYWVNYQWVFGTSNGGTNFNSLMTQQFSPNTWKSTGFDNINMLDIEMNPANSDLIFQAYFDIGLWKSVDHGQSWTSCNPDNYTGGWSGHGGNCAEVESDPQRSNVVWATMSGYQQGQSPTYLLKNTNTGDKNSWLLSNTGLPTNLLMGLTLDESSPMNNRTLYITADKDVYKSTNDGSNWTKIFNCNGCEFTAIDPSNSNIIYAGGEAGVFKSIDGGSNFSSISISAFNPTVGTSFWDWNYSGIWDIQTAPNQPNVVYVVVRGASKGLYKSSDGGNTWTKILNDNHLRKMKVAYFNPNIMYATSSSARDAGGYSSDSNGVLYSTDGGATWTPQNTNMAYPFAIPVAIDYKTSPSVFVGSPGTGFQSSLIPNVVLSIVDCNYEIHQNSKSIEILGNNSRDYPIEVSIKKYDQLINDYFEIHSQQLQPNEKLNFTDYNLTNNVIYTFYERELGDLKWDHICSKKLSRIGKSDLIVSPNPTVGGKFMIIGEIKNLNIIDVMGHKLNFTIENVLDDVHYIQINSPLDKICFLINNNDGFVQTKMVLINDK